MGVYALIPTTNRDCTQTMARISMITFVLAIFGPFLLALAEDGPAPLADSAARMKLPKGFQATLFAGEPDVVQPIAMTFDDRGRLWVVECLSYPDWLTDPNAAGHDRVLIFEDRDGDGRFDERKVFLDDGRNLSGIELGFRGVWLCSTPNLVFVPDADGDDVPDGPQQTLLDGWDLKAKHNVFNGLAWGPDGWLYGLNGILSESRVGRPGTPDAERVAINCGVWRYHPTRRTFEVVAHGTTNPWGIDFDEYGQAFFTNCVIHHLWQVVPGARYQRMFGQDFNPHTYGQLASCADHIHWGGGPWQSSRGGVGEHNAPGGGHAHSGAMIYLGDNWPDEYRGNLFTCNLHGSRVNRDLFERAGSTCVARHGRDFLMANDPWFRGLVIKYGPDGGVYLTDWCDTGECHDYDDVQRTNGRIYKITYGKIKPRRDDLAALDDLSLVRLQTHRNDWQVAHARRLLQERAVAGRLSDEARTALQDGMRKHPRITDRLRAVWALHVTGGLTPAETEELLASSDEDLRGWAVRFAVEQEPSAAVLKRLAELAASDPSPRVRLELASALQRLPLKQRWEIARPLLAHADDADDASLPLMDWYAVEPLVEADPERALALAQDAQIPLVRQYLARRLASGIPADVTRQSAAALQPLARVLARIGDDQTRLDLLRGVHEALAGRRRVLMPPDWPAVYEKLLTSSVPEVVEQATLLSLVFGDRRAAERLRRTMFDDEAPRDERQRAVAALVQQRDADLAELLERLLATPAMRGDALRGLAAFGDDSVPTIILRSYSKFSDADRADAIATLSSRPKFALALIDAIESGAVSRGDISAFAARQLVGMKDEAVGRRLAEVWGVVRDTSSDKAALIAKHKARLTAERLKDADRSRGRLVYDKNCAACHKLFGDGGKVGPELTGAQRQNVDYLFENLADPSALVGRDYQMTVIQTVDGRVLNGIITADDGDVLTVRTQNDSVLLPKNEIEARELSKLSLMPEGVLDKLSAAELRDLVAYLSGDGQVSAPAEAGGGGR